jgi:hypothetical protein
MHLPTILKLTIAHKLQTLRLGHIRRCDAAGDRTSLKVQDVDGDGRDVAGGQGTSKQCGASTMIALDDWREVDSHIARVFDLTPPSRYQPDRGGGTPASARNSGLHGHVDCTPSRELHQKGSFLSPSEMRWGEMTAF